MKTRRSPNILAFSLIELMVAVLFLTIAFFGYVALHARILHSGQRLEEKEVVRAATDYYSGILVSRAAQGGQKGPDGTPFIPVPEVPNAYKISTTPTGNLSWLTENWYIPEEYEKGMDQTMQLSPTILGKPYAHDWSSR